jgi:hypothetical protein
MFACPTKKNRVTCKTLGFAGDPEFSRDFS